tara:strand:- start:970 stop:1386 length:417 start_codon:yes stop_codon:yes gene_type:complete
MKVDIFKRLIREVIREELDFSLKRLENNIQEAIVKNKVTKIYEEAPKEDVYNKLQKKLDSTRVRGIPKGPVNTKNQVLNDILAETAQSGEWKDMDRPMDTKSAKETTNLPDHLADAFNKDYSQIIKKADEKSKMKNGI